MNPVLWLLLIRVDPDKRGVGISLIAPCRYPDFSPTASFPKSTTVL
jgi:hypothetical protein